VLEKHLKNHSPGTAGDPDGLEAALSMIFAVTTVLLLCYRLARGVPFGTGATWLVAAAGNTAVAAGFVPVMEGTAKRLTVANLSGSSSIGSPLGLGDPAFYISSSIELLPRVGVSIVNLSLLKNGHAKAIRFSTLSAICHALSRDVGDLLTVHRP
jgi:DNA-binding Xre family transcriptional regulator